MRKLSSVVVVLLTLALAGCSKNDADTGADDAAAGHGGGAGGGDHGGGSGGGGVGGTVDGGACSGTDWCIDRPNGGSCPDTGGVPPTCGSGQWQCPADMILASECKCYGFEPPGCNGCGPNGWICPDGGAGSGGGGKGGAGGRGGGAGQGSAGTGGQGTAGRGGGGTGGAATAAPCPTAVPHAGDACSTATACYYEDCAGAGRSIAHCMAGQWRLETAACAAYTCGPGGPTCSAGQICVIRQGGARFFDCKPNGCGTGSITCGCLQSCEISCTLSGAASDGFTLTCNICGQPPCA